MNLLLDTHALIWFLEDDPNLSKSARAAISDPGNFSYVSDATAWEVGIKHALGKLSLPLAYEELFPQKLFDLGFHVLPIRHTHLHQMIKLPRHHGDPFDRLLIAQAQVEGYTMVSCDSHFPAYGISLLW
jgi:PIN domain nuclease of toxin-antitoxin system